MTKEATILFLKIRTSLLLVFAFIYPPLVYLVGSKLNYIYFPLIGILVFSLLNLAKKKIVFKKRSILFYVLLVMFIVLCVINWTSLRYTFPILFFIVGLLFLLIGDNLQEGINSKVILIIILIYVVISSVMYFQDVGFVDGRFSGFAESATTYSVYMTALLVIAMLHQPSKKISFLLYFATAGFIFLSQTRINLGFVLILPFIIYFVTTPRRRALFMLTFIISVNFLYPLYLYLKQKTDVVSYRYEDGYDPSFLTRMHFQKQVVNSFLTGTVPEKIFGHGMEYTRQLILTMNGEDYLPHNDFLRLLNDFGLLGFALYIFFIYRVGIRNITTCCLSALYLVSFYHNMIFNFFLLLMLLTFLNYDDQPPEENLVA